MKFAIEDTHGSVARISIYNFPTLFDGSLSDVDALFPIGTYMAIREPMYKMTDDGTSPLVRVDSPSDIIFLQPDHPILRDSNWNIDVGPLQMLSECPSVEDWNSRGVVEGIAQRWLPAAVCYTNGLKVDSEAHDLRLSRCNAYMTLKWYNSALNDAEHVLNHLVTATLDDGLLRRAILCTAEARYHLGLYASAALVAESRDEDPECMQRSVKARQRLHEEDTGEYDWCTLFETSQGECPRPDVADFIGPIAVREDESAGGGRGVFATRDVKLGELLVRDISSPYPVIYAENCHARWSRNPLPPRSHWTSQRATS